MRFIVAPDSFKGSLSSAEAGEIMSSAILAELPRAIVRVIPMADGGEGTVEAFVAATGGRFIEHRATGPLGRRITTRYGVLGDRRTAVIEVAAAAGLTLVPVRSRNPLRTTTYGVGESILHALGRGLRRFIIGLGGSATNDGGMGMLQALGARFLDRSQRAVQPFASGLSAVRTVDYAGIDPRLFKSTIRAACDVDNPLCGPFGASFTFAAQKGATPSQIRQLDKAMAGYAGLVESHLGRSFRNIKGAGAAGGMGFALLTIGAELASGASLVCEAAGMERLMAKTDWLITGEGKTDNQTLRGKAPFYLASLAKKQGVRAILISGCLAGNLAGLRRYFHGMHSIAGGQTTVKEAMANAGPLLYNKARDIVRLLKESIPRR